MSVHKTDTTAMTGVQTRRRSFEDDFGLLLNGLKAAEPPSANNVENVSLVEPARVEDEEQVMAELLETPQTIIQVKEEVRSSMTLSTPKATIESVVAKGTAVKKPSLRFHEAEDVGDAAFLASWERKVENMLNATATTTTIDVSVQSEVKQPDVHIVTTKYQTEKTVSIDMERANDDLDLAERDDDDQSIETDRDPLEEEAEMERIYAKTEQMLNDITELQTTMSLQDAMIAKILETVPDDRTSTNGSKKQVIPSRWLVKFVIPALLVVFLAIVYQWYFAHPHLQSLEHKLVVNVELSKDATPTQ